MFYHNVKCFYDPVGFIVSETLISLRPTAYGMEAHL